MKRTVLAVEQVTLVISEASLVKYCSKQHKAGTLMHLQA